MEGTATAVMNSTPIAFEEPSFVDIKEGSTTLQGSPVEDTVPDAQILREANTDNISVSVDDQEDDNFSISSEEAREAVRSAKAIREAKMRADFRSKFYRMRRLFPAMHIPEPRDDASLQEIEATYRQYRKGIHVQTSVDQNRLYLIIMFLLIEYFLVAVMKLPFSGYMKEQLKQINRYNTLLTELAERSYVSESIIGPDGYPAEGEEAFWSPTTRIIYYAVVSAIGFGLVCVLAKYIGKDTAETLKDKIMEVANGEGKSSADVLHELDNTTAETPEPISGTTNENGDLMSLLTTLGPALIGQFANRGQKQDTNTKAPRRSFRK